MLAKQDEWALANFKTVGTIHLLRQLLRQRQRLEVNVRE